MDLLFKSQETYNFTRETAYNVYCRSSHVISNSIVAVPSLIILSVAFSTTTFFAVGLSVGLTGFFFLLLTIFSSFWAGTSLVTFLSSVVTNVLFGYTTVITTLSTLLLFSGFFVSIERIPPYWLWLHYVSLVKYHYDGELRNEFGDPTRCFVRGAQVFDGSPLGALPETVKLGLLEVMGKALNGNMTMESGITTGPEILRQQGIPDLGKWNWLWTTLVWGFLFRIMFYFSLLLGSRKKRN